MLWIKGPLGSPFIHLTFQREKEAPESSPNHLKGLNMSEARVGVKVSSSESLFTVGSNITLFYFFDLKRIYVFVDRVFQTLRNYILLN